MTVKLLLLKSGENVIADVKEMVVGDEENPRVVGYFLHKPCVVGMSPPKTQEDDPESLWEQKASFQVTLFPWIPLSRDNTIPVSTDWVITIVNPTEKLEKMYVEEVINYGKTDKDNSTGEQSDTDNSD